MSNRLPKLHRLFAVPIAVGFFLVGTMTAVPAQAEDAPPAGFPSWADVQQAKGDAAATANEVSKVSLILDSLDQKSGELGDAAVQAGADFALTQGKLDAATAEVSLLNAQTARAAEQASKFKKEAVAVAVQSYKSGGAGLGLFATISVLESPDSLNGADMLHQVGERAAIKQARANAALATAASLEKTRKSAELAQQRLTSAALGARDSAVAAQKAVTEQLESKKAQSGTLVAQLASLNNTSVAKEQEFRQGQVALAAYNQAQAAKRQAAAEEAARRAETQKQHPPPRNPAPHNPAPNPLPGNPVPNPGPVAPPPPADPNPNGGFIPVEVLLPNIPGGAVNNPAGAQAYAAAQLGGYGWAQDQFQCLAQLWERESNWRTNATNPYSGAYGIAQALPPGKYGTAGADWLTNYRTQVNWGLGYIKNRYGSPCGAWGHSQSVGWY
ncbi:MULTISPECIES: aggregation-promoting factor C-terminal-like domain-containing protein [Arthrobacter]|uniref:aggregation-promoting factor C-terminal-like domain-containing protein n=1 Tax=unclassified Arthrobacter TaxID=235627 RepID=UPI0024B99F2D|nr:hypothetical protein [Arthrobacter sp. H35-MC1]MDJ0317719.1 hypothetical protein [Arthrobacter sp. H35-MC1]